MSDINLNNIKKAYFIGIGGIGMSAVARMFSLEHAQVFGSDLSASEVTDELQKRGAKIQIGVPEEGRTLPEGIDLVIYTVAIPEHHPELVEARRRKIPILSYPETLALISKDKFTIAVAGTHGKTTTTAMIAKILIDAGLDPTVIVGSLLRDKNSAGEKSNFIAGKSNYFVVEACEYKRSFLNLKPNIAVVTNIDDDHLDYYKNLEGIQTGFTEFLSGVKDGGVVVTDTTNEKVSPAIKNVSKIIDYTNVNEKISLKIPGRHNIQNAKAALAVALLLGVSKEKALESLAHFSGTWRRFEDKGETATGTLVYDDYAHHPSEIAATLQAACEKFPNKKIIAAFQPHLYSRTKEHLEEFGPAFALADKVLLLPIYAAREPADPTVSSEMLVKKIGEKATYFENFESAADYVKKNLTSNDVLFTMGAGDITNLSSLVLK